MHLASKNIQLLREYWTNTDVEIEGDAALQQGMRFNALQLLQSAVATA